jgi:YHS domain-containing protein
MKMKLLSSVLLTFILTSCTGQKKEVFSTTDGAIDGYDPVAYHTKGQAVKGSEAYAFQWNGATWYFESDDNQKAFEENPEAFAPQYGGYCAYAVSQGYTAKIDPDSWKIVDNKLYLNYSPKIQAKWEADQDEYIMYADSNWPKVLEK